MDRQAFKERLQQYKQAKEQNPQLKYYEFMVDLAKFKANEWNEDEDLVLTHMLNDNSYNYRQMYEDNPNYDISEGHFEDTYKTVYHPTFSEESIYSGKKSQYNPQGIIGGHWDYDKKQFQYRKGQYGQKAQDYLNNADPGWTAIPQYGDGTDGTDYNPRITSEGYDNNGYFAQAMNPLPELTVTAPSKYSERPVSYASMGNVIDWRTGYNPGAGALEIVSPEFDILTGARGIANSIMKNTSKQAKRIISTAPKSEKPTTTFLTPFKNNLGEYDFKTNQITSKNSIFGKLLGEGSEQVVYQSTKNPSKVLKVYNDIGHKSLNDMRKFVNNYKKQNNVPFFENVTFDGYVTNGGKYYPVFSQNKVNLLGDNIPYTQWKEQYLPMIEQQLNKVGYSNFRRGNRFIDDIQPGNVSIKNGKVSFTDVYPEGFKNGGIIGYDTGTGYTMPKYFGAYSPGQQAYVLPVYNDNGMNNVVMPEVSITPRDNTNLAQSMQKSDVIKEAMMYAPGIGDAMDVLQIGKDVKDGNYGMAALGAGLMILPDVVAKPIKRIARKINKSITAPKRASKLRNKISEYYNDVKLKKNYLRDEYSYDELDNIVANKEQQYIKDNPDVETHSNRDANAQRFRHNYKREQEALYEQYPDLNFEKYYNELPQNKKALFRQLSNDDPLYIKFVTGSNLPFDSQDTVDKWIQKQRTGIRGVYSDIPNAGMDVLEPMFTLTKNRNPGGDRLRTDGGLYISNSMDIADRFSRSMSSQPGTAAYGYTIAKDIDRSVPIREQLSQLRRRIYPFDLFYGLPSKADVKMLKKHGYIGKQAQYTTGDGKLLPAYETAFFADTPNTKVVDVSDVEISDVTKNIAGRWGQGAGGADVDDMLYSPRVIANSYGDFLHEYRTFIDQLPLREKANKILVPGEYNKFYKKLHDQYWDEFNNKLKLLQEQQDNFKKAEDKVYKIQPRIDKNVSRLKTARNIGIATVVPTAAVAGILANTDNVNQKRRDKILQDSGITSDLKKYKIDLKNLDPLVQTALINSKMNNKLNTKEDYINTIKDIQAFLNNKE